ncbi:MAG: polymerase subunit delta, partial [Patescibacteria group bacterium]|nr:polymerase subunit delta [Patescibacteria group bacterium]
MADFSHHAFLIPHTYASIRDALHAQLNTGDDAPEIIEMVEGTFPIDSVRQLIDLALRKSEERGQVFLVAFDSILPPAQNALLKVLEEPVPHTHFFLITSNPHTLLPTVLSRLGTSPFTFEIAESSEAKEFLASTPSNRLSIIKPIIEEKDRRAAAV